MGIEHQLKRYIVYTCKKCNWQTAILAQWADLKPKKCQNRKCNCLFLREPDKLDIKMPKDEQRKPPAPSTLKKKTKTTRKKTTGKKKSDDRQEKWQGRSDSEARGSKDGETSKS
jgi:hypothetical protein